MCGILANLLDGCNKPLQVVEALIAYSEESTKRVREVIDEEKKKKPKARQPSDSRSYPGKIEHATCVAIVVE